MIDKKLVEGFVNQWLEGKDYFLTDLTVSADNRIVIEIDHQDGVWIEDCVDLSRHVEAHLNRDEEDFELEVGSAGIGQPFKVYRQYVIHQGERIEVVTTEGKKLQGLLSAVTEEGFTLTVTEKVKLEGEKRPKLVDRDVTLTFAQVKSAKYLIDFK